MNKNTEKELTGVKEIARRAKVSIATVDRVLHNRVGVSAKTKKLILSIIEELDYQPNILARSLAIKKSLKFSVLIPKSSDDSAFWAAPLDGILKAEDEIKQYGIIVEKYLFNLDDISSFVSQSEKILEDDTDAILLAPVFVKEAIVFIEKCKKLNIPYVFINSDIADQNSLCYIGPDLYYSGYMGAHLLKYLVTDSDKILLVNVSRNIDKNHHLMRKEEGFRAYYKKYKLKNPIVKIDIRSTDYTDIKRELDNVFKSNSDIKAIFVSNSRVSSVAHWLEDSGKNNRLLIGFDFLPQNVEYLKKDIIDFLISQKPHEQGYKGIMVLYNKLLRKQNPNKINFMPIDIITRENYMFYQN